MPAERKPNRIRTVSEAIKPYLAGYSLNHRPLSVRFSQDRLAQIERRIGDVLLSDLTDDRVKSYIGQRQSEGMSGRTINMELGELSRAIGHKWSILWPKIRKLEERKDVGRALSLDEQHRLLDALESSDSRTLRTLVPLLLLTGMRSSEATSLRWVQVDLVGGLITVGRAKTANGTGRVIPINVELAHVLALHGAWFTARFGEPSPGHYLFPWGSPEPIEPTRHVVELKRSSTELRKRSAVSCRLHDLRHTFATGLAESGATESTMLALMGHISRSMLETYSHIRISAKREAVAGLTLRPLKRLSALVPVEVPVPMSIPRVH